MSLCPAGGLCSRTPLYRVVLIASLVVAGIIAFLGFDALLISLLAMFGVNRMGQFVGVSGSRGISDDPQDLWEDE